MPHPAEARELRLSEERFRLLVESVVDYAIFMLDRDGHVESWNIGAQRLKGYAADEIIGRHYSTFYPPELRQQNLPAILLERATRDGSAAHSGWRVRKDGTRFWADVVITALHHEDGSLAGFAKVTRDMTDAHRAEEAREQLLDEQQRNLDRLEGMNQWRQDFVRSVAHDLENPVTSIVAFSELLNDDLDTDELRFITGRIVSNARLLRTMIEHLRIYTLLESRKIELAPEHIDVRSFIDRLVADMGPVLGDHELDLDCEPVHVRADAAGLERILRNLLANAARHSPEGSTIRVVVRDEGEEVVISVSDEGEGIAPELLPKIFDRFERGPGGGTGLGLAIVRQYAELHGGAVTASSNPGAGSTFRLTLPRG